MISFFVCEICCFDYLCYILSLWCKLLLKFRINALKNCFFLPNIINFLPCFLVLGYQIIKPLICLIQSVFKNFNLFSLLCLVLHRVIVSSCLFGYICIVNLPLSFNTLFLNHFNFIIVLLLKFDFSINFIFKDLNFSLTIGHSLLSFIHLFLFLAIFKHLITEWLVLIL